MAFPHIGPMEIGLVLVIVLIVFGVGRLPQVGGALGKSIREFRKARSGEEEEDPCAKKATKEQMAEAAAMAMDMMKMRNER